MCSHYAQLCLHLFGYHYARNYASVIHQGLLHVQGLGEADHSQVNINVVYLIVP